MFVQRIAGAAFGAFFVITLALSAAVPSYASEMSRDQIEEIVKETIRKNPEIILEAFREIERKEAVLKREQQAGALKNKRAEIEKDPASPVAGTVDSAITMVEFFDYQCGYCKRSFPDIMKLVGNFKVRYVFKEFPILGEASQFAARAALAANMQGKYVEMHAALMTSKGGLSKKKVLAIAQEVGLDMERLKKDFSSDTITQAIKANIELAQSMNITGTPAFIVGEDLISGADMNSLQEALSKASK